MFISCDWFHEIFSMSSVMAQLAATTFQQLGGNRATFLRRWTSVWKAKCHKRPRTASIFCAPRWKNLLNYKTLSGFTCFTGFEVRFWCNSLDSLVFSFAEIHLYSRESPSFLPWNQGHQKESLALLSSPVKSCALRSRWVALWRSSKRGGKIGVRDSRAAGSDHDSPLLLPVPGILNARCWAWVPWKLPEIRLFKWDPSLHYIAAAVEDNTEGIINYIYTLWQTVSSNGCHNLSY